MSYFYDGESDLFFICLANAIIAKFRKEQDAINFINHN